MYKTFWFAFDMFFYEAHSHFIYKNYMPILIKMYVGRLSKY